MTDTEALKEDVIRVAQWTPIEEHDGSTGEVLIAIFDANGRLYHADRGWWEPGEVRGEWDEVDDGIRVKLWEEEDDGHWTSNHGALEDPTHFMPLAALSKARGERDG